MTDDDLRRAWQLALRSLRELRLPHGIAASSAEGLYHAVFGRDTLWIVLLLLETEALVKSAEFSSWVREVAGDSLRTLAGTQGSEVNNAVEEQPGRIIHELQLRPTAHALASGLAYDSQGRSFAGFDQTFLFITAIHRYTQRFPDERGDVDLWQHAQRAVGWIESDADEDGDGLYEYTRRGPANLVHQVWKDSFDSITHVGFDVPAPPIAWIDVQGYAYQALIDAAEMYDARGLPDRALMLRSRADSLRQLVNEAFWIEDEGCLAVALDGRKRPIRMVTSNPGHALWGGIVDAPRAAGIIDRLLRDDMSTEYGVRTLAATSSFYAPFAYHRGNIWPHDNAILVSGLLRYGEIGRANQVMEAVVGALLAIGSPIELYLVLETDSVVSASLEQRRILLTRTVGRQNHVQGFSAAGLLTFAARLAEARGIDLGIA